MQVDCSTNITLNSPTGTSREYNRHKAATLYLGNNAIVIIINYSKFANMNMAIDEKAFEHELVHAFDVCKIKRNFPNCHDRIYSEVRAYNRGGAGCERLTGEPRIKCVIKNTISNLFTANGTAKEQKCKNYTKNDIVAYIKKNYHSIIKGMPF